VSSHNFSSHDKLTVAEFASLFRLDPQTIEAAIEKQRMGTPKTFFTIPELAKRWGCSRGSVYNYLRDAAASIIDFASKGKKGKKLVPLEVVERIERQRTKKFN